MALSSFTPAGILSSMEAQRWQADQASREQAQLDERSVWIAVQVKISEGRVAEAETMVREWRANRKAK